MPTSIARWHTPAHLYRALRWWRFSRAALTRRVRELQAENRAAVATIAHADARAARAEARLSAAETYFQAHYEHSQRHVAELEQVIRDLIREREEVRPD